MAIRRQFISSTSILNILANPTLKSSLEFLIPTQSLSQQFLTFLQSLLSEDLRIHHLPINVNPPWQIFHPRIDYSLTTFPKSSTNPVIFRQHFYSLTDNYPEFDHVFTDGSKTDNLTGCSIIHKNDIIRYPLPSYFSILSAELYALKLSITYSQELPSNNIIIFTDSLCALLAIENYRSKKQHPLAQEIVQILSSLNKNLVLCWIPSHCNIPLNELADQSAKQSIYITPIPNIPIPLSDLKTSLKLLLQTEFNNFWNSIPISNKLKQSQPSINSYTHLRNLTRKDEVTLTRILTGHSILTHSYLLNKQPNPVCESCQIPISIKHILIDCPKFNLQRNTFIPSRHLPTILANDTVQISLLLQFLKSTKLYPLL